MNIEQTHYFQIIVRLTNNCKITSRIQIFIHLIKMAILAKYLFIACIFYYTYIMFFRVIVILLQLVAVIFIGGFARSFTQLTSYSYFTNNQLMIASWVLMYSPFKKIALHSIIVVLILAAVVFEAQILFGIFWEYVFEGFNGEFNLATRLLIEASYAQLAIVLIAMDFIGVFRYWQIYFIFGLTCAFGYALNSAILLFALDIFDSGGGLRVFAFSGMAAFVIWALSVRARTNVFWYKIDEHYHGQSLSLLGLIGVFITWPTWNASGGYLSFFNTYIGLTDSSTLQNCGYYNCIFGLSVSFCLAFIFSELNGVQESKIKIRSFIDSFVNCGVAVSCFAALQLNPAPAFIVGFFCSIFTILFYKYFKSTNSKADTQQTRFKLVMIVFQRYCRTIFRIIAPFIGIIVCSIIVDTRSARTPTLYVDGTNYPLQAGLQIVGYLVTLGISACFGALSGVFVNLFMNYKEPEDKEASEQIRREALKKYQPENLTDFLFFDNLLQYGLHTTGLARDEEDLFPLYLKKEDAYIDEHETARKMIRETMLSHIKQNNETQKKPEQSPKDSDDFQTLAICSRIMKNSESPRKSMLKNQKSEIQLQSQMNSKPLAKIRSQSLFKQQSQNLFNNRGRSKSKEKQEIYKSQEDLRDIKDPNSKPKMKGLLITSQKPPIGLIKSSNTLNFTPKPQIRRRISYGNQSNRSSDIGDQFNKP